MTFLSPEDMSSPGTRIIMVTKGISASHPIILLKMSPSVVICSIGSERGDGDFDYSIVFHEKDIPWKADDDTVLESLCDVRLWKESSHGHKLALENGMLQEHIEKAKSLIERPGEDDRSAEG